LGVVLESLRKVSLAVVHPVVPTIIGAGCKELPVIRLGTIDDQFSSATLSQSETRVLGIDTSTTVITHCHTNATITRHINSVEAFLFDR
jgi:hypothetical protein